MAFLSAREFCKEKQVHLVRKIAPVIGVGMGQHTIDLISRKVREIRNRMAVGRITRGND